ncbi:MAG: ABC transporter ATP-binding protein/permease [Clostridiales bacterium]|jgi:ATP-binding cassette subfamily B protein|nr:ABC transporter ATP-binding protein/permease [Clostridiales bacterium]
MSGGKINKNAPRIGGMRRGPGHGPPGAFPVQKAENFSLTLKKLIRYMKGSIPAAIAAMLMTVGAVAATIFIPKAMGDAVDLMIKGLTGGGIDVSAVLQRVGLMITLGVAAGALRYGSGFIFAGVSQKITFNLRRDIYAKIDRLPLKYFDKVSNGEVLSYLTNDVDTASTTLSQTLSQVVMSAATIAGVLVMMFMSSWILTLIAILIIPVSLLLLITVVKFSQKYFTAQQKNLADVNGHIEEAFAGHNVITLYNNQDFSKARFDKLNGELYDSARKSQFFSGLMMPVMMFTGNLGYVLICAVGGLLVIGGVMSVGAVVAFMQYLREFNQPVNQSANIINTLQSTVAAAERIFKFLDADDERETGTLTADDVLGDVEFKNVRFGYEPDKIVINDFSCKITAGSRVAIVGPTGAGKTTVVKLLMRFYDLDGGNIALDGVNTEEFSRGGLRKRFAMVLQDAWLFNGTVRDNIRYGKFDATDDEVHAAAATAYADRFIRSLPGDYDFVLNEEADNISLGQKQLLTIARAVLADPRVLILDEATSSVDTRTELLIQRAMESLMRGRTSFVIAHRLSTIKDADTILVMRGGDIVEQGPHDELIRRGGFYAELYNSQFE